MGLCYETEKKTQQTCMSGHIFVTHPSQCCLRVLISICTHICSYEWLSQSSLVSAPFKIYLLFSYCISSSKVSSMLHPYVEQSTAAPVWNIQLHMQSCANAVYIALMFIIHVRYMQCIVTCSASSLWSVKVLKHNPNLAALVTSLATNVSLQPIHALS